MGNIKLLALIIFISGMPPILFAGNPARNSPSPLKTFVGSFEGFIRVNSFLAAFSGGAGSDVDIYMTLERNSSLACFIASHPKARFSIKYSSAQRIESTFNPPLIENRIAHIEADGKSFEAWIKKGHPDIKSCFEKIDAQFSNGGED